MEQSRLELTPARKPLIVTPEVFAENGFPPVLASPEALYPGFHVEQYHHRLPALDLPPIRDTLAVIALAPIQVAIRQGKRFASYTAQTGEMFIYPRGCTARLEWRNWINVVHLRVETEWLQSIAERSGISLMEIAEHYQVSDPRIRHIGLALRHEVEAGCPNGRLFGESLMTAFASHLLTRYAVFPVKPPRRAALSPDDLARATDFIQDRLTDELSLDAIAAEVGYSPDHFARLFKARTGQTPFQFARQQRLARAYSLLQTGAHSVAQVAAMTGFADQSHLCRAFKKRYALTPKDLRPTP